MMMIKTLMFTLALAYLFLLFFAYSPHGMRLLYRGLALLAELFYLLLCCAVAAAYLLSF